jgi:hypothetical protein
MLIFTTMVDIVLVFGNWSSFSGKTNWAYLAAYIPPREYLLDDPHRILDGIDSYQVSSIGGRIFEPPNQTIITNPKNCDYGQTPAADPLQLCKDYAIKHGYNIIDTIKMRTDF